MTLKKKRIVITGTGLVTPLGSDVDTVWQRLINGESGIDYLPPLYDGCGVNIAGIVKNIHQDPIAGFNPDISISPRDQKRMERFILFALVATEQALKEANWLPETDNEKLRTATIIASGIGGLKTIQESAISLYETPTKKLSPFTVPSFLANLAAGQVSIKYQFKGSLGTPVTACSAGIQAIGDAVRIIQNSEADIAICGGAESCIDSVALAGFHAARALTTEFNSQPHRASRPFDTDRSGFVIAEGSGILVIESLEHALNRGAKPIAEIVGYATTADAFHITASSDDADGAYRSMKNAIHMADISPNQIDYINAHATSTPLGDISEITAIKRLFKNHKVAISSTKSSTGHLLGAAGGIAAIFTALSLKNQIAPISLNCDNIDPIAQDLNIIHERSMPMPIQYALCNGFGFGGVNASLVMKKWIDA
ncbi:beta-ketoacyl-ACP synthase II [Ignatzschineria sp. LJL83]